MATDRIHLPGSGIYEYEELRSAYGRMPEAIRWAEEEKTRLAQRPEIYDPEVLSPQKFAWDAKVAGENVERGWGPQQLRMIGDESPPVDRRRAAFHDALANVSIMPALKGHVSQAGEAMADVAAIPNPAHLNPNYGLGREIGPELGEFEATIPTPEGEYHNPKRPWANIQRITAFNTATDLAKQMTRNDIRDILAERTHVEPKHLEGLGRIWMGQGIFGAPQGASDRAGGHYSGQRHHENPEIWVNDYDLRGDNPVGTLIHEIGHHVSTKGGGYEQRMGEVAEGPVYKNQYPAEEAFADDYAMNMLEGGKSHTYWDSVREQTPRNLHFRDAYLRARAFGSVLSPNHPEERAPSGLIGASTQEESGRFTALPIPGVENLSESFMRIARQTNPKMRP